MRNRQHGITMMGFLIVLIVLGFFAYMAMRLIPMYSEYSSIAKALDATVADPTVNAADEHKIRDMLSRHFEISYVDSIDPMNNAFPKGVVLKRSQDGVSLTVNYDVAKPFFYNISLVGHFEHTASNMANSKPAPGGG